jgi:negative regulator of sigma E activity
MIKSKYSNEIEIPVSKEFNPIEELSGEESQFNHVESQSSERDVSKKSHTPSQHQNQSQSSRTINTNPKSLVPQRSDSSICV